MNALPNTAFSGTSNSRWSSVCRMSTFKGAAPRGIAFDVGAEKVRSIVSSRMGLSGVDPAWFFCKIEQAVIWDANVIAMAARIIRSFSMRQRCYKCVIDTFAQCKKS